MFESYIHRHRLAKKEDLPVHISILLQEWKEKKGFGIEKIPRLPRDWR